jgi:hypothetical protein
VTLTSCFQQVSAHKGKGGEDISKTPGCEDYKTVAATNVSTCCPSLPNIFKKESDEKCQTECKGKGYCCTIDCGLKAQGLADASGKFDAAKAKEMIKAAIKDAKYVRKIQFRVDHITIVSIHSLLTISSMDASRKLLKLSKNGRRPTLRKRKILTTLHAPTEKTLLFQNASNASSSWAVLIGSSHQNAIT